MPTESRAQHNYMEMIAHDPKAAKREGVSQAVAREFVDADRGRNLKEMPEHVRKKAADILMRKK